MKKTIRIFIVGITSLFLLSTMHGCFAEEKAIDTENLKWVLDFREFHGLDTSDALNKEI
jgi:hypothetical protein